MAPTTLLESNQPFTQQERTLCDATIEWHAHQKGVCMVTDTVEWALHIAQNSATPARTAYLYEHCIRRMFGVELEHGTIVNAL